jgi:hypothetical protein
MTDRMESEGGYTMEIVKMRICMSMFIRTLTSAVVFRFDLINSTFWNERRRT